MKVKRTAKSKSPARRNKARPDSSRTRATKKSLISTAKNKKSVVTRKKKVGISPGKEAALAPITTSQSAEAADFLHSASPYAALNDEHALANAWEMLGDEEYLLDDEVWNTLYNRIKLQLLQASYSFRIETEGMTLSAYSVTPMPAFRANHEPGYLNTGSFTLLSPDMPGVIFDLKVSASDNGLLLDWVIRRKDSAPSSGHMAFYLDGELVEAVNLQQNRAHLEVTREDMGDASFYFLDAETGRQTKILTLSI